MALGWAELLVWMQQPGGRDAETVWQQFRSLAATSKLPGLPELSDRFHAASADDRRALATTIASLLAPVEWPDSWRQAGRGLVKALDDLVQETRAHQLPSDLLTVDERDLYNGGWSNLAVARDLLGVPCRRDELRTVAHMCNLAHFRRWQALKRALMRIGQRVSEEPFAGVRRRYVVAFSAYVEAARAMNAACGTALFSDVDLSLDDIKAA